MIFRGCNEEITKTNKKNMILPILAELGGSIHVGLAAMGAGIGIGLTGLGMTSAVGRNPVPFTQVPVHGILAIALTPAPPSDTPHHLPQSTTPTHTASRP